MLGVEEPYPHLAVGKCPVDMLNITEGAGQLIA
jgi:hypothetical protein